MSNRSAIVFLTLLSLLFCWHLARSFERAQRVDDGGSRATLAARLERKAAFEAMMKSHPELKLHRASYFSVIEPVKPQQGGR